MSVNKMNSRSISKKMLRKTTGRRQTADDWIKWWNKNGETTAMNWERIEDLGVDVREKMAERCGRKRGYGTGVKWRGRNTLDDEEKWRGIVVRRKTRRRRLMRVVIRYGRVDLLGAHGRHTSFCKSKKLTRLVRREIMNIRMFRRRTLRGCPVRTAIAVAANMLAYYVNATNSKYIRIFVIAFSARHHLLSRLSMINVRDTFAKLYRRP